MKQKLSISLTRLEKVINEMMDDLRRYASKDGAKDNYVQKQNGIIEELCAIHADLDCLDMFELWSDIEQRMKELEKIDPQIDSHCIVIQMKPGQAKHSSFIELKPGLS